MLVRNELLIYIFFKCIFDVTDSTIEKCFFLIFIFMYASLMWQHDTSSQFCVLVTEKIPTYIIWFSFLLPISVLFGQLLMTFCSVLENTEVIYWVNFNLFLARYN